MRITLSNAEYKAAVDCANLRMFTSNEAGWNNASTYERTLAERLNEEVVGACGEIALCKAMNWFWSPSVNTFHHVADVGAGVEVRSTALASGCCIIRDNDADDRWFVLVTGQPPEMTVRGRIMGAEGKQDCWLKNPHGRRRAWFVPQSALRGLPNRGGQLKLNDVDSASSAVR